MALQVQLVSPEQMLYSGEAGEMVVCRTTDGDIAFQAGHAPFLGALGTGIVRIVHADREDVAAIHGGFVEVTNDTVIILSDVAEMADDIDVARARAALARAEEQLAKEPTEKAEAAAARATARLRAAGALDGAHH